MMQKAVLFKSYQSASGISLSDKSHYMNQQF